jgi:alkaline phosphatase D
MTSLRPPGLGPIVGHTTDHSCRLWIRAGDPDDRGADLSSERRTLGVLTVLEKDGRAPRVEPPVYYFRLHREFDRTGTFNLGVDVDLGEAPPTNPDDHPFRLEPDSEYRVRMGTLTVDDPLANDKNLDDTALRATLPEASVWRSEFEQLNRKKAEAVIRTLPSSEQTADALTFLLGSCRYPGLLWKIKRADKIFGPMREQVLKLDGPKRPRLVLMVGDQIYADMFNRLIPIGLADTYEEFQERYLTAFGSRNMRQLLRHVPTYMILDDHEIEDNWSKDRLNDRSKRFLFNVAINAYMSYQWSHGPRNYGRRLFYNFDAAGYPFFVLDVRTQRIKDDRLEEVADNHMLGRPSHDPDEPGQLGRLLSWLKQQQEVRGDAPKFIVSASVFVPNAIAERTGWNDEQRLNRSDSWAAFPTTRAAILNCIIDHDIQNVVFLSGDIHCTNIAEMSFTGSPQAESLKAFSITSSAFYWPFPFADGEPSDYVHNSRSREQEDTFHFGDGYRASNFTQLDNFCRVEIDRDSAQIVVHVFDDEGEPIKRASGRRMIGRLKLTPW